MTSGISAEERDADVVVVGAGPVLPGPGRA
jgi:hypothetical protein